MLPHNPLRSKCVGLLFHNELMQMFYHTLLCDYKNDAPHVEKLDAAVKANWKQTQNLQEL
ncbi:TPR superfamily protein [Medicago truncatula]|uniref:TPR superfamily protein n=1 Tax=Medicago truncatula TaxID=3880 RepID=G7KL00_MEDTR|nr:TPR superfamily protein [Medicago truncatula]